MADLPPEASPHPAEGWIPVAEYTSLHEAGVAQGMLESAGIASVLDNETMVGMLWHLSNAVGGVRVRVAPADEEAARALLAEGVAAPPLAGPEEQSAESKAEASDDDEPMESEREAMVRRALVASLLGFFIPILLHLWALTLIVQVPFAKGRLDHGRKVRLAVALALTLVGLAVSSPILWMMFGRSR